MTAALFYAWILTLPAGSCPEPDPPGPVAQAAPQGESADPGTEGAPVRVEWRDGLRIVGPDDGFEIRLGGRIQQDWGFFHGDGGFPSGPAGEDLLADGTQVRRARLSMGGTLHHTTHFAVEYEFASPERADGADAVGLRDAWVERSDLPGTPRVGHFFEPFGLEAQTDARALTFHERSLPAMAFAPGRNAGLALRRRFADGAGSVAAGVFRETDDTGFDTGSGESAATGRVTFAPRHAPGSVLHLGLAYSLRNTADGGERYAARPEANLLMPFADTGLFRATRSQLLGGEAAWVEGPWSLQGEAMLARVDREDGRDPLLGGASVQASWLLSGESRPYADGVFGRVQPRAPLRGGPAEEGVHPGRGAFELAARYSFLDLDNDGAMGGELTSTSLGLNWYLDPSTRVQLGYVGLTIDGRSPVEPGNQVDMLLLRFELDF